MSKELIFVLYLISSVLSIPINENGTHINKKFVKNYKNNGGRALGVQDLENLYGFDVNEVDSSVLDDAFLTVPQLLVKYNYPVEIHKVRTEDGYILEMHRIPKPGGTPIYLQHGIIDSSAGWIIMGPRTAFAYQLSDLGFDVWMGNVRGNRYSREHIYLDENHRDFWDFSFHEMGIYDLPAMIDFIIAKTGYKKIHYVGHSQGTTCFWIMSSQRPEYNEKIESMHALAPIAYMSNVRSPFIRALAPFINQLEFLMKLLGEYELLPNSELMAMAGQILCRKEAITQSLCENIVFLIAGYNSEQLNKTMLPVVFGHMPAGASTKQFIHYGQLVKYGGFKMFDYGYIKNLWKYGSLRPPSYDLSKVTAPVALHYSSNDWLAHVKDVLKLEYQLPNIIKHYLVPYPKFNHLDFLIAIQSRPLVYDEVIGIIQDIERKKKTPKKTSF